MIESNPANKIIDEVSNLAPKIYDDLVQPASKEIGQATGRTVKALLTPLRAMLWGWERIEKVVTEGVEKRLQNIPEDQRKAPEPEIAVPLIQALSYTAQNETLRDLYLNLLSNSMDLSKDKDVHPSFVDLIKQMNTLDAKVFQKLSKSSQHQNIIQPRIFVGQTNQYFVGKTPEWYIGWTIPEYDIFDISKCIVRLSKFGLIDILHNMHIKGGSVDKLLSNPELIELLTPYNPDLKLRLGANNALLSVNEYGMQFKEACMPL
jgi:hypothetical protein